MKIIILPHIIVHFYFAFGVRRRDTGRLSIVLNYLFLTAEKVIADSISVCVVVIRTSLLIGQSNSLFLTWSSTVRT